MNFGKVTGTRRKQAMCVHRCYRCSGFAPALQWSCLALPCSLQNLEEPLAQGEDFPVASMLGLERGEHEEVRTPRAHQLLSLSHIFPTETRSIFLCGRLFRKFFLALKHPWVQRWILFGSVRSLNVLC